MTEFGTRSERGILDIMSQACTQPGDVCSSFNKTQLSYNNKSYTQNIYLTLFLSSLSRGVNRLMLSRLQPV